MGDDGMAKTKNSSLQVNMDEMMTIFSCLKSSLFESTAQTPTQYQWQMKVYKDILLKNIFPVGDWYWVGGVTLKA